MADKDWTILKNVAETLADSGLLRLVKLGAGPKPEDVPASQLPACFVDYAGTDEFPAAGDDEVFCAVRFRLILVVQGGDPAARISIRHARKDPAGVLTISCVMASAVRAVPSSAGRNS